MWVMLRVVVRVGGEGWGCGRVTPALLITPSTPTCAIYSLAHSHCHSTPSHLTPLTVDSPFTSDTPRCQLTLHICHPSLSTHPSHLPPLTPTHRLCSRRRCARPSVRGGLVRLCSACVTLCREVRDGRLASITSFAVLPCALLYSL